jgi:transposase
VIAHGLPIYVALEAVDMRLGSERLGAIGARADANGTALARFVRLRWQARPQHEVLTWDGTGTIVVHKKLDAGGSSCRVRQGRASNTSS